MTFNLVVLEIEQKRPVNNSSQNGSRYPQFCMKIDLALLIPTIYITHIIQKWHLEQNGSQATNSCRKMYFISFSLFGENAPVATLNVFFLH